jgi:predicted Zn-dependent protease
LLERGHTVKKFASVTHGVSLVNLYRLTEESYEENKPLSLKFIQRKKKEIT